MAPAVPACDSQTFSGVQVSDGAKKSKVLLVMLYKQLLRGKNELERGSENVGTDELPKAFIVIPWIKLPNIIKG